MLFVAPFPAVAFPPFIFHGNNFRVPSVFDDGGLDDRAFHRGGSDGDGAIIFEEQNPIEGDAGAGVLSETLHRDGIADSDFELLTFDFYNCKHDNISLVN